MEHLARLIFEESPTTAHDLIRAINEWDALLRYQEQHGSLYDAGLHPDNPVHLEADRERRQRLDGLRKELEYLVQAT